MSSTVVTTEAARWYLSQVGRREHYALAAELHARGRLGSLCTDVWAPWAQCLPRWGRPERLAQRHHAGLVGAPVSSPPLFKAVAEAMTSGSPSDRWVRQGSALGAFAVREFARRGLGQGDRVLGHTCANLEQLLLAKKKGACGVHVQVDPGRAWYARRRELSLLHPDKEPPSADPSGSFWERTGRECAEASCVVVHSLHSKEALSSSGFPRDRMVVIPPPFLAGGPVRARRAAGGRPLRVLFAGSLCLMKGFHVFVEVAREFGPSAEFRAAGGVQVRPEYLSRASNFVRCLGHLSARRMREEMARADVLVFPTFSDGFGLVQLEAMAAGLPVIATGACGEAVRDGVEGFVVPVGDVEAVVERLRALAGEPALYEELSRNAAKRPGDFSPGAHLDALERALVAFGP